MGYISRGEDEARTRHNTWNGFACPVMTLEQTKDFIELQDWRIFEGENLDKWELSLDDEGWKLTIWNSEEPDEEEPYMDCRLESVESVSGNTIEVFGTPCYTFEEGHGPPGETCSMESLRSSPYWLELRKHG